MTHIIFTYVYTYACVCVNLFSHTHTHMHARTRIHQTVTSSQLQFWQQCKCMPLSLHSHFCLVRSVAARVKFRHFLPNGTGTFTDSTPAPSPTCGPCIAFMAPNSWPPTSSHTTLRKIKHEMWHKKIMSNTTMEGRTATLLQLLWRALPPSCGVAAPRCTNGSAITGEDPDRQHRGQCGDRSQTTGPGAWSFSSGRCRFQWNHSVPSAAC